MKKLFCTVLTVISLGFLSSAQDVSPIFKLPKNANGYLILNKAYYTNATSWTIVIKERTWNPTTNQYDYTQVSSQSIVGKNYLKIPETYRSSKFVASITGYEGNNVLVQANEIIIGPDTETMCTWVCNGSNYAYALQMNEVPFQGVKIKMAFAPAPNDAPFYYQWVQAGTAWNNFRTTRNPNHYGFSSWADAEINGGDAIINLTVPSGQYKYDEFGTPMNGNVIGVAKYFGPSYTSTWGNIVSNGLIAMESDCMNPIQWAIDQVNNGTTTPVTVACNGTSANTHYNEAEGIEAEIFDPESDDPCVDDYLDYTGWHAGSGSGVYQLIKIPCNWLVTNPEGGNGTGISWPENVTKITMKSMHSTTPTVIELTEASVFGTKGNFIGPNHTVPQGFYNVIFQYSDLSIGSYYVDVPTNTGSVIYDKDFLTYNVYPVPITNNQFSIDLNSSKKGLVKYIIRDAQNQLVKMENIDLQKNVPLTKQIILPVGTPNGILYNSLVFPDGSTINFTTIK